MLTDTDRQLLQNLTADHERPDEELETDTKLQQNKLNF